MASLADRWYIPQSAVIDWHEWGHEFVVHVASRAETHLLSPAAGSVLVALLHSRSPMTFDALYANACHVDEPSPQDVAPMTAEECGALRSIVAEFERLGIASREIT